MPSWPSSEVRSLETPSRKVPPDVGAGVGAPPEGAGVNPVPVGATLPAAAGWFGALGEDGARGAQAASKAEPAPTVIRRNAARRPVLGTERRGEVGRVCNAEASRRMVLRPRGPEPTATEPKVRKC